MAYWNEGEGRRVGVVGLGISGRAAAALLKSRGFMVSGFDSSPDIQVCSDVDEIVTGETLPSHFERLDGLVVSPGVNPWSGIPGEARRLGIPVIGEIELAAANTRAGIYAVTGSNGKTTTAEWLGFVFSRAGFPAVVCGNTGYAFSRAVLEKPDAANFVVEISSYQLETTERFRPRCAAVLNLTPDHLERHKSLEGYAEAKARIFLNQHSEDITVLNGDDVNLSSLFGRSRGTEMVFSMDSPQIRGAWIDPGGMMMLSMDGDMMPVMESSGLSLPGRHNAYNALAVVCLAYGAGLAPGKMVSGLSEFPGVQHRMETVLVENGVTWINDSKSTNPDSLRVALEAVTAPVILIAGGRAKMADYGTLEPLIESVARKVLLFGEAAEMLSDSWKGVSSGVVYRNLEEVVRVAKALSVPGDTVLLSPGCASFDQYSSFEERGRHFRMLVEEVT
jgi:UDP-N-acetylmuramoylalanine--D-glutamate ligase